MKLYKIDFTNTIGDYMVTVPTDSQFLIGISNGDSEADVELLEGETEITPEDEKIGAYTVFKFETDGTPFRKHLKANINGQKPVTKYWDAHEYNLVNGEDTSTIAILDGDVFAELKTEPNIHAEFDGDDTMTVKFKDASGNYSTTLTYTYNNALVAGGIACTVWDAPEEIDEEISSTYLIPKKIRIKNVKTIWGWNKIEPNYTGQSSTVNWKATPLVADIQIPYEGYEPYTDKLNIVVKCDKMSVAYRDETGLTSTEAVQAVKDSGEFVVKDELGQYTIVPLIEGGGEHTLELTPDNAYETERIIYEVGARTDADYTTKLIVNTPNNMTGIYKFNVAIYCKGDGAYSTGESMLEINTRAGEDSYVTYPVSIPVAGYGSELGFVIQDSVGKIILATITIWAIGENYCTANITGVVNSIPGVEPEP